MGGGNRGECEWGEFLMAATPIVIYRNYDSSDTTINLNYREGSILPSINDLGWDAPTNKEFKEWNSARDGSGTSYSVGDVAEVNVYAIWEDVSSIDYLTTDQELTSIANAIRTKGGTSASLTYPAGFVSAIENLPSGGGIYQAKTNITPTTSSQTITPDSGYDALSSVQINAMPSGTATTPATTITAQPTISVNSSTGVITASNSKTQNVTPAVSAGYVSSGTAGTITVSGSNTSSLTTQAAQTITPTTTDQTIASGKYLTGAQTIKGDANLIAGNIKKDVSIFGVTGSYEGGGGSSATTVTFYDNGSGTAIFGGNYIAYIDGNGDYQLTTSLKDPSSEPESYQMLSGSLLTYVAATDPEMSGIIAASYTGMTFKESKKITLIRQSVYLRFYQID